MLSVRICLTDMDVNWGGTITEYHSVAQIITAAHNLACKDLKY